MSSASVSSPSWGMSSNQQQPDIAIQSASSASRWLAPSEDFFDSFVNTNSFHGPNEDNPSDFPLDYLNITDVLPTSNENDALENAFLCSKQTNFDEAQNSWRDSAVLGDAFDPALPCFDDAFSANYAPSDSFLSSENNSLLNLDPFHSQTELDLVALPSRPSQAPVWTSKNDDLQETKLSIPDTQRGRSTYIEDSEINAVPRYLTSSQPKGRQLSQHHTMPARRWEDHAFADQVRSKSFSEQQDFTLPAQLSQSYYSYHDYGKVPPSNKFYDSSTYRLGADSAPLYRDAMIPGKNSGNSKLKQTQPPCSPIGSPTFDSAMEGRNASSYDAQPGLTFSSYPSTPRSYAEDPGYPMTPPQIPATESRTWKHDQADAPQNNKAEDWWNLPTDQSEVACVAPTTPRTLGLGISNTHSANLGGRVVYPSDTQFMPDSTAPTSGLSRHFSYDSGASASFDQMPVYTVPQAQMMPMQPQQHMQSQEYGNNQMSYHTTATTISPAQMSNQPFTSPVPMTSLPFLNKPPRASSMASSTRASSTAFSRASSYRSSTSPSPGPRTKPHTRVSQRRDQRKQNRSNTSRASNSSRETSRSAANAEAGGFINYTPSDKKRILTGVAPSGSSKTKARREKEAAEQKRKISEAARMAILSGNMGLLESGVFGS